ncbi:MAG: outer membrane beta-barrel protein [Opitutales bacterium]|nr:outer membrane beta-barrel protein [Opitutales bacterium]
MKKILITSLLTAFAMAAESAPLVTVGDQMDIFFRGAVLGNYNSNITYASGSDNKIDDYSGTLRLGAEVDYGRTSKFKANIKFHEDITRYVDHKNFDSDLAHIIANASYVEANWKVNAHFSFDQMYQNDSDLMWAGQIIDEELIRYNMWKAGVKGSYDFSEKMYGTLGFDWNRIEYCGKWDVRYSSYDTFSVPASVLYRVTQKVAVGMSYQYRKTDYFDGPMTADDEFGSQRDDHFIGLTANGEIAPKLTFDAYLGGQYRDYDTADRSNDWTMSGNITLGYEVSEKCGVYVKALRDFGNSAMRYSYINTSCEGGVNYYFNPKIVGTACMGYRNADYEQIDREDDTVYTRVGVSYVPNKFVTLSLNYNYLNNDSDTCDEANYNQHLVTFSASLRY